MMHDDWLIEVVSYWQHWDPAIAPRVPMAVPATTLISPSFATAATVTSERRVKLVIAFRSSLKLVSHHYDVY